MDRNSFKSLSKTQLSIHWFSQNSQSLSNTVWISHVPKFTQIRWKMQKTQNTSFTSSIKCNLCCTGFHKIHIWSMPSCGHLIYRISPKQVKKYGMYRQKFIYAHN
jgi:hypothetical protein